MFNLLAQIPDPINIEAVPGYLTIKGLQPQNYVRTTIRALLALGGVAAFIYLLWGGVQWIMAGGDKDAIDKARKKVVGALIGLAIVFSAYAIMYILETLFGVSIGYTLGPVGT
ncbi:hypothetical protein A2397_03840 [Candidatus Amesbacteria bacterium RIFOXYB1_FULL_44_23]|uniref:Uncharacterized protein n=1 Tax=Candidatus Amesbacteria bacterium RIFOXYB1_FULL_44_23 TaxID=1797263 RepID=A0A1F4ZVM0_9BACT|nr:MAG: hypothetical protein A2397_03840 [Candidatus Amesbacteria bacterium RIFOXYB1_FULL_44_23]